MAADTVITLVAGSQMLSTEALSAGRKKTSTVLNRLSRAAPYFTFAPSCADAVKQGLTSGAMSELRRAGVITVSAISSACTAKVVEAIGHQSGSIAN